MPKVVQKLSIKTVEVAPLIVEVANGNRLTTTELCPNFSWQMHGQHFEAQMIILPVGGCEVSLGHTVVVYIGKC